MQTQFNVIGSKGQVIAIFKVKTLKAETKVLPMYPAKVKADKIVVLKDLRNKWEAGQQSIGHWFNAEVNLTKKTVRIYGQQNERYNRETKTYETQGFNLSFAIGSRAEYDSYNLVYVGTIVSIGEKTVKIKHYENSSAVTQLTWAQFVAKNWDFDMEAIAARNQETSYSI